MAARKKGEGKKPKKQEKGSDRYPRQNRGRFAPGNPGKPAGAKHWANRKIATVAREYLDDYGDDVIAFLLSQRKNTGVLLETIKFLTERADGKAPQTVKHGLDPDSPEGILLAIANQPLPGQRGGSGSDEDTKGERGEDHASSPRN